MTQLALFGIEEALGLPPPCTAIAAREHRWAWDPDAVGVDVLGRASVKMGRGTIACEVCRVLQTFSVRYGGPVCPGPPVTVNDPLTLGSPP
jgi:hypothetical protein